MPVRAILCTQSFSYALGLRDRFLDTNTVFVLQANSCDQNACNSAYPSQCPSTGQSGSCLASSVSSTASSSPSPTFSYTSASGTIALDTSSVSEACKSTGTNYQCSKSYAVAVSGSSLTLTSTSGPASACAIGDGKRVSSNSLKEVWLEPGQCWWLSCCRLCLQCSSLAAFCCKISMILAHISCLGRQTA